MGCITAVLMTYTTPEDAFYIMRSYFNIYGLKECFLANMPGLENCFYIFLKLVKKYMPKLFDHLMERNFIP